MRSKIEPADFTKQYLLSHLKLHPSKPIGLFFEKQARLKENDYGCRLCQLDLSNKKIQEVDVETLPDDFFLFEACSIFIMRSNFETQVFEFNDATHALKFVFKTEGLISDLDYHQGIFYYVKKDMATYQTNLYCWDSEQAIEALLFDEKLILDHVFFDVKSSTIVFNAFEPYLVKPVQSCLYSYDVQQKSLTKWTNENERIDLVANLDHQHMVYMAVDLNHKSRNDNLSYYLVDKSTGKRWLANQEATCSIGRPAIVSDHRFGIRDYCLVANGQLFHVAVERFKEVIRTFDANGTSEVLDTGLCVINDFGIYNNQLIISGCLENAMQELYVSEGHRLNALTCFHEDDLSDFASMLTESATIDGWVIPPKNFNPSHRYPGVLCIHGGPKMIYTKAYNHDMALLSDRGYFVFFANPSGSDGRGDGFSNIRGQFGTKVFDELMAFVTKVCEAYPQIDETRLGVMGGSYGGYMTNYIITKSKRFKAAISERGICNLSTTFLTSDIGFHYVGEYMGNGPTPWSNLEAYIEASPLYQAYAAQTPTLFNHGSADVRCHPTESIMMHKALLFHGIDSELHLYEGEGHGFVNSGKPLHRLKRYERVLDWFDRYLCEENENG